MGCQILRIVMVRFTRNKASADASVAQKKPSAKKPQLAIEAAPRAKESYEEAPFLTASQMKAKDGKTWEMVSCICKSGEEKDPACQFCKKSHWDPPVEGKRKRERPVAYT